MYPVAVPEHGDPFAGLVGVPKEHHSAHNAGADRLPAEPAERRLGLLLRFRVVVLLQRILKCLVWKCLVWLPGLCGLRWMLHFRPI